MNKIQLKKLIKEVLREVEDPKTNTGSGKPEEADFTKHSVEAKKKADEAEITMTVRGVKPGGAFKKFLAKLTADALAADWAVLSADMNKSGVKVASMNHEDITTIANHVGKPELAPAGEGGEEGGAEEEPDITTVDKAAWKNMSPEKRAKYIKTGSHSEDWEKAGKKDEETKRKNAELSRRKAAKIAAGTYDPDDQSLWTDKEKEAGEPDPTALWPDKEWDAWNAKQDQAQTYDTGKSAGKYKPNLSKKTAQGMKGAVRGNFSDTLRHE